MGGKLEEQGVGGNFVSTLEMYTGRASKGEWVDETKGLELIRDTKLNRGESDLMIFN